MKPIILCLAACLLGSVAAHASDPAHQDFTPSGQAITPLAAAGAQFSALNPHLPTLPLFTAGQAVSTAVSPDDRQLLILTSGFNQINGADGNPIAADSNEYIFVYDISERHPVQTQVLEIPNSFMGLAFAPDGQHFYASGGVDDNVHVFAKSDGVWAEHGTPIALGHKAAIHPPVDKGGLGIATRPLAANLAVSADGKSLVVANFENDSVSVVNLATRAVQDIPLRPGVIDPAQSGVPGGEYPFAVAIKGNDTAYISSERDREIDVVTLGATPHVSARIKVSGNPNKLILNKSGSMLYVACDNEANIALIDTAYNQLLSTVNVTAPVGLMTGTAYVHGTAPDALALSPDEKTLYVTDGGMNALAVISLSGATPTVEGLIPTGYYPNAVSVGDHGKMLYVVNGKSIPGPNPGNCLSLSLNKAHQNACYANNNYILQLSKAGFLSLPVPSSTQLATLTRDVAANDYLTSKASARDDQMMAFLHAHIKHIIYIVRENRTYDQLLGDLGTGDGDPSLAEFGQDITPNAHALASNFVDLDRFFDPGEVSGNGWQWSTSARESDIGVKTIPLNYADRGASYDWEGGNRNVPVGLATTAERVAEDPLYPKNQPDLLPGTANVAAPDGPQGQIQRGYIWDAALRAGLTVRNYGFFVDLTRYHLPVSKGGIADATDPASTHLQVAYELNPTLAPFTDIYFRGFDNNFPDLFREAEWQREFAQYVATKSLPSLEFVRLMHDHLGNFRTAMLGVNTPAREVADNDYAVGKLIEAVAHSPYAVSTLIFVVEDDAQDGPDHVDAHRSIAFIAGPYVRHHAVVSTRYSTVNMIRTIEDILGFGPMTINDAYQPPMTDIFNPAQANWTFTATEPAPLTATQLPQATHAALTPAWHDTHNAQWWARATPHYDWDVEDHIPTAQFNRILWSGMNMKGPYPGG